MVTTPTKDRRPPPERTPATELPQELCRFSEPFGMPEVESSAKMRRSAAGRTRKEARARRAAALADFAVEDEHPTILAAAPRQLDSS